jgi:hypothetical protein
MCENQLSWLENIGQAKSVQGYSTQMERGAESVENKKKKENENRKIDFPIFFLCNRHEETKLEKNKKRIE